MTDQYRIGAFYEQNDGDIVELREGGVCPKFLLDGYEGTVPVRVFRRGTFLGWRRLDNGMLGSAQRAPDHGSHLIPGEVDPTKKRAIPVSLQVASWDQWFDFAVKPHSIASIDDEVAIKAALQEDGSYFWRISESTVEVWDKDLGVTRELYVAAPSKTPTLDKLSNTAEPKRPALDWNKPASVDRFPGFKVDRMDINHPTDPWKNNNHALQRIASEGDPLFGSAYLKR